MTREDRLIAELQDVVGLDAVDAHRAAFTALAVLGGWPKARIGRYLGVSRARVGQKVEKLEHYAATHKRIPTLRRVMRAAEQVESVRGRHDQLVQFSAADWDDLGFARQVIDGLVA